VSRAVVVLTSPETRRRVAAWAMNSPAGTRVTFQEAKRTTEQNSMMWACLTDIARQVPWHGLKLSADDWKLIFMAALNQEMRLVPNIEGTGFVNLGRSSSSLSKGEMTDLIELILKFGAEHDVEFSGQGAGGVSSPARAA